MKIKLELHEGVIPAIKKILNAEESEIELQIPENSVLFDNSLNLKLIEKEAERNGKEVFFKTSDEIGQNLINSLSQESTTNAGDFSAKEITAETQDEEVASVTTRRKFPISLPVLDFSRFSIPQVNWRPVIIALVVALVLIGGVYAMNSRNSEAEIKMVLSSQPLTKSIEVKVVNGASTNAEERVLSGSTLEVGVEETATTETTGEKIIGEVAKGRVKIYNKTDSDMEFDKGEELVFDEDDEEYVYILDDDVEVPARTDEDPDPSDPTAPPTIIPGEALADVVAEDIGGEYNINAGETLEFNDYKTTDFIATVTEDISGGSSETVKVVAEEDLETVSVELELTLQEKAKEQLGQISTGARKRIAGSEEYGVPVQEFSAEVGDEAEEITLKETLAATSLAYSEDELNSMIDELLEEFVPEGFELFTEEKEVSVEVLGNSDSTVLSAAEADLQVTVKAFVVPEIDDESLKQELAGKSPREAEKILGSVRNILNYELQSTGGIPIIGNRLPSNPENISLKIERE